MPGLWPKARETLTEDEAGSDLLGGADAEPDIGLAGHSERYLTWIEIINEKTEEEIAPLGEEALNAIRQDLKHAPSLNNLAKGHVGCIPILQSIREQPSSAASPLLGWLDRVIQAFDKSKWLAGEMLGLAERLIRNVRELSESINMRFLYDLQAQAVRHRLQRFRRPAGQRLLRSPGQ